MVLLSGISYGGWSYEAWSYQHGQMRPYWRNADGDDGAVVPVGQTSKSDRGESAPGEGPVRAHCSWRISRTVRRTIFPYPERGSSSQITTRRGTL